MGHILDIEITLFRSLFYSVGLIYFLFCSCIGNPFLDQNYVICTVKLSTKGQTHSRKLTSKEQNHKQTQANNKWRQGHSSSYRTIIKSICNTSAKKGVF